MEPIFAGATALAAAIRARELSAVEATDAHLARIARHNPALNAVVILDEEGARSRAREADAALARGESWGPLHGVPFTLKDAHATAGLRTTLGFPPLAGQVTPGDGTVAARLKGAGGVLLGKTNVATLLGDFQTDNPLFGRTNNPWDAARTPGGSGGGAAAAVAAGLAAFDVGTDLSGSIRLPAHCCGVYGLKPTERRVSLEGVAPDGRGLPRPLRIMSCVGPIARSVDDLALVYGLLAGPDGRDTEVPPLPVGPVPDLALAGLRIAVAPTLPGLPVARAIRDAVLALAARLADAGAIVEEAALPDLDYGEALAGAGALIGMLLGAFGGGEGAGGEGDAPATLADYLTALDRRDRAIVAWERFFGEWDALLCPVAPVVAFPHCPPGTPLALDGGHIPYYAVSSHSTFVNYTGHPALSLPLTLDGDGLPIGAQLVGRRWDEARLLGIARAVAPLTAGFRRPPGMAGDEG